MQNVASNIQYIASTGYMKVKQSSSQGTLSHAAAQAAPQPTCLIYWQTARQNALLASKKELLPVYIREKNRVLVCVLFALKRKIKAAPCIRKPTTLNPTSQLNYQYESGKTGSLRIPGSRKRKITPICTPCSALLIRKSRTVCSEKNWDIILKLRIPKAEICWVQIAAGLLYVE